MPEVPDRSWHDPLLGATLHTGEAALRRGSDFVTGYRQGTLAVDCETPGFGTFTINCLTAAWQDGPQLHTVLLDVRRDPRHHRLAVDMMASAENLVLHNAPYDVPILYTAGLIGLREIARITDTLITARVAYPDNYAPKSLTAMVARHLGLTDFADGMKLAFRAAGYRTVQDGYEGMDIDAPIYRLGAMADTVATLRLLPEITRAACDWLTDHPYEHFGATTPGEALEIIETQQRINRVMLSRSARGLGVDTAYLDTFADSVETERLRALALLAEAGLEGGSGKAAKLVEYLEGLGELPPDWPRTPTGKLRATKADLDGLDHPLAAAQRKLAEIDKVTGYLEKVSRQAEVTGRCHPQVGILGASQTGRWSVSHPELHQFSAQARPIITGEHLWSIDWSQIEPIMLGNMSGGTDPIITAYESGGDLYEPLMRSAGVDRDTSKRCLLASMYGMGITKLAYSIGHTGESAAQIRRQMFAAMPASARFMTKVQHAADTHGRVITVGGRILPVTDEGSHKSINHIVQGSAADQLGYSVCQLEEAGLADRILIGMHDELVVDCTAAEAVEIERLMQRPHPNLKLWSGRDAILRTDRQELGTSWAKV